MCIYICLIFRCYNEAEMYLTLLYCGMRGLLLVLLGACGGSVEGFQLGEKWEQKSLV